MYTFKYLWNKDKHIPIKIINLQLYKYYTNQGDVETITVKKNQQITIMVKRSHKTDIQKASLASNRAPNVIVASKDLACEVKLQKGNRNLQKT